MLEYVNQVKHNEEFISSLCTNFNDKYFDWKVTSTFYCAYHLLQALASHRGVNIGHKHKDIFNNIRPNNPGRILVIKDKAFNAYDNLFEYSRTARYDGYTNFDDFQLMKKADYEHSVKLYQYFKNYILGTGITI